MANSGKFQWHPSSRLFAGKQEINRSAQTATGFQAIAAQPSALALSCLAAAIESGAGFCLYQKTLPDNIEAPAGTFLTLTGGTSGAPKTIRRSHNSWIASFAHNASSFGYMPRDAIAVFGALSHSLALYGVVEAMHLGLHAHVLDGQSGAQQRAQIIAARISILYLTPSQLRLLCTGHARANLPSVRLILCGGGAIDAQTRQTALKLCPNARIHVFYGAAETSFITISDDQTPEGSVGKPYPGVEIKLAEDGEVWVKSPYLFDNYATGTAPDTRWQDGFLTVGETGSLDGEGNLWLKGRKTRMVTVADQNVFPEEVEARINDLKGVGGCAVLALPDNLRGHRLIAVLEGSEDTKLAQTVRQVCIDTFGSLIAPKTVLFQMNLPRLPSGKVDLKSLTNWVKEQL